MSLTVMESSPSFLFAGRKKTALIRSCCMNPAEREAVQSVSGSFVTVQTIKYLKTNNNEHRLTSQIDDLEISD